MGIVLQDLSHDSWLVLTIISPLHISLYHMCAH